MQKVQNKKVKIHGGQQLRTMSDKVQTNVKCKHWYVHPLKSGQILHQKKGKKHISEKWATAFPGLKKYKNKIDVPLC